MHAFGPPEFIEFISFFDPAGAHPQGQGPDRDGALVEAGLDSVPGGGGEIFADAVRRKIGLGKCTAEAWLTVMRVAHELGLNTSATMMFGHIEGIGDRIHHMDMVRRQDEAITDLADDGGGRYHAFISWPFQPDHTPSDDSRAGATSRATTSPPPSPGTRSLGSTGPARSPTTPSSVVGSGSPAQRLPPDAGPQSPLPRQRLVDRLELGHHGAPRG